MAVENSARRRGVRDVVGDRPESEVPGRIRIVDILIDSCVETHHDVAELIPIGRVR